MRRGTVLGCFLVALIESDCLLSAQEAWTPGMANPPAARGVDAAGRPLGGAEPAAPFGESAANSPAPTGANAANPPAPSRRAASSSREAMLEIDAAAPREDPAGRAATETLEPPDTLTLPHNSGEPRRPFSPSGGSVAQAEGDAASTATAPRDVRGGAHSSGPTIGGSPRGDASADVEGSALVAAGGGPQTPARLVASDLQARGQQPLAGRPLALVDLLSIAPDRRAQLEAVAAYWRLVEGVCVYHACLDYDAAVAEMAASAARPEDAGVWRGAMAASAAIVREAGVALASAQCDAALLAGLDPSEAAPLPVDPPHAGAYQTRFDELFATAPAPAQVRLLAKTLPLLAEAIDARAAAVRAAGEVVGEETARYRGGGVAPDAVLAAMNRHLRQRQSFHAAVGRFNRQIAEYVLGVAPAGAQPEALLGMMIVRPRASRPTGWVGPPFGAVPATRGASDPAWGARAAPASGELRPVVAVEPLGPSTPGTIAPGAAVVPFGSGGAGAGVPGTAGRPTLAPRPIPKAAESEARPLGSNEPPQPAPPGRQVPTRAIRPAAAPPAPTATDPAQIDPIDPAGHFPVQSADSPPTDPDDGASRRLVPIPDGSTNGDEAAADGPPRAVPYRVNRPPVEGSQPTLAPREARDAARPALAPRDLPAATIAGRVDVLAVGSAQATNENGSVHPPSSVGESIRAVGVEPEVLLTSPALFAGLLQATPVGQSKQVAAALCAGPGGGADESEPLALSDCLRAAASAARGEAIDAYWQARCWASKYQVIEEQAGWLDELALAAGRGVAAGAETVPDGLPARWRAARSATEAERLEARTALVETQFALAALTGRGQDVRLPMPTTVPHAGRYDPKLGALPPQQRRSWALRRLAAAIGGFGGAALGHATAVVEADVRRAELVGAFARGEGRLEAAIEAIERQAAAASAFLDALAGYNQAIGRYVLSVVPAGAPVEVLGGAMVAEP